MRRIALTLVAVAILGAEPTPMRTQDTFTIQDRLDEFGDAARARLRRGYERAGVSYPGEEIVLVAYKDAGRLDLRVRDGRRFLPVASYPILAASGTIGPKLAEGDLQVPEGIYRIELLNPNSRFHVSLRLSYPNAFDREMARRDGRTDLGGDIMIHGKHASRGCLAVGDEAAEELFTLAHDAGLDAVLVVIAPTDLVSSPVRPPAGSPPWTADLYRAIAEELRRVAP